jgi:hypothetical protein
MATATRIYRKLPGSRNANSNAVVGGSTQLFLAEDHLLAVTSHYFTEAYRRFYFRDIRSIVVQQTHGWWIKALVHFAIGAGFASLLLVGLASSWPVGGMVTLSIFAALFLLLALAELLPGPSCRTFVQTAVQRERLWSLGRVRRVRKALKVLRPKIEELQGTFSDDELMTRWARAEADGRVMQPVETRETRPYCHGGVHALLFTALLLDAAISAVRFVAQLRVLLPLELLITAVIVVALVASMIRQHGSSMPGRLRLMSMWILIYLGVLSVVGAVTQAYYTVVSQDPALTSWQIAQNISMLSPDASMVIFIIRVISTWCSAILALVGFRFLATYRRQARPGEGAVAA